MPCDTRLRRGQTTTQRKQEVRDKVNDLSAKLVAKTVKPVVDKRTGAIAFQGWQEGQAFGITDACAYRRLLIDGSALAKAEIARAEQIAGRAVDRQALTQGVHSHDGGETWHHGH